MAERTLTFFDYRSANPSYSGERLRSRIFRAKLSGFVRLANLRKKVCYPLQTFSCATTTPLILSLDTENISTLAHFPTRHSPTTNSQLTASHCRACRTRNCLPQVLLRGNPKHTVLYRSRESTKKGRRGRPFDSLSNLKAEGLYLRFKFRGAVLHLNLRGAVLTAVGIGATLGREATDALLLG